MEIGHKYSHAKNIVRIVFMMCLSSIHAFAQEDTTQELFSQTLENLN